MFSRYSQCVFLGLVIIALYFCTSASGANLAIVNTKTGKRKFVDLPTNGLEIIGIALLGPKLYAVCVMNDTIFEFSKKTHALLKTYTVNGMGPGDMVADPVSKQLFISDWRPAADGGLRVWRFKPSTGQYFYYNNGTGWTGTLSLSPKRSVVGVSGNGGLNRYRSSLGLKTNQMPPSIVFPQHAIIPTKSGRVFVSYGGFWANGTNTVAMLSANAGAVLRKAKTPMKWPRHLAFGSRNIKTHYIYVADYCNRRVIRLNHRLSGSKVILNTLTSPSVDWPQRLLFDKSTHNLYVAMASTPISC